MTHVFFLNVVYSLYWYAHSRGCYQSNAYWNKICSDDIVPNMFESSLLFNEREKPTKTHICMHTQHYVLRSSQIYVCWFVSILKLSWLDLSVELSLCVLLVCFLSIFISFGIGFVEQQQRFLVLFGIWIQSIFNRRLSRLSVFSTLRVFRTSYSRNSVHLAHCDPLSPWKCNTVLTEISCTEIPIFDETELSVNISMIEYFNKNNAKKYWCVFVWMMLKREMNCEWFNPH